LVIFRVVTARRLKGVNPNFLVLGDFDDTVASLHSEQFSVLFAREEEPDQCVKFAALADEGDDIKSFIESAGAYF